MPDKCVHLVLVPLLLDVAQLHVCRAQPDAALAPCKTAGIMQALYRLTTYPVLAGFAWYSAVEWEPGGKHACLVLLNLLLVLTSIGYIHLI
jgi:hypothetical protein